MLPELRIRIFVAADRYQLGNYSVLCPMSMTRNEQHQTTSESHKPKAVINRCPRAIISHYLYTLVVLSREHGVKATEQHQLKQKYLQFI